MHDEVIDVINAYVESLNVEHIPKLMHRLPFLEKLEKSYNTAKFKPTYGSVHLHNGDLVTVPVFDMKTMILSILHDKTLMQNHNFAPGLDIFTGTLNDDCVENNTFGEIHTGDAWNQAVHRFSGEGKYMPLGLVVFGDKSHSNLNGTLSLSPVTFTATFFNSAVRNNPDCWQPMGYIPNLAHANVGGGKASDKSQNEHNCLAYVLKSLIDLSEAGGIRTIVMGRLVHVKPFIMYFIGDTEGFNKWLGHYNSSKPRVHRPYRDCHCSFGDLSNSNPLCVYTEAIKFRRAKRMVESENHTIDGLQCLSRQSRHNINNALYQSRLPLSDGIHGANRMCPPELLHVLDAGLMMYILESLQGLISGGQCRDDLINQHYRMYKRIKHQSERDLPRGAIRSGLIETTRCQSSERKGNFFLLMCIAHTNDGELILRHELGLTPTRWRNWRLFLRIYLAMGEWFHASRPKEEVRNARGGIGDVIEGLKELFPRKADSHGYNLPKMHGLTKMQTYMCLFGSGMNFYSGAGEASHK